MDMALEGGNKLWEGHRMILPEHEAQLWRARKRGEEYRPPVLAENALEEIQSLDWTVIHGGAADPGKYASKYGGQKYIGFVMRIDPVERWLVMQNGEDKELIPFSIITWAEELFEDA